MKSRFTDRQEAVKTIELDGQLWIFLCLNEEVVTEEQENIVGNSDDIVSSINSTVTYYDYDYNEFHVPIGEIDIDDVKDNPEQYLYYGKTDTLSKVKQKLISESKDKLEEYLENHPLFSTAKYSDGRYYSCTAEKQYRLTSSILLSELQEQSSGSSTVKWNDTGNVCEEWTATQLMQLSTEIYAYVEPLVTIQQTYEKNIVEAETMDDINKIELKFE